MSSPVFDPLLGEMVLHEHAASTTPPGGSDTQFQYNNAGAFGGVAGMTYVPPDISIVGDAAAHGATGSVTISSGASTDDADVGGVSIVAEDGGANGGAPGSFSMRAGTALFGNIDGGSFSISGGDASGSGTGGGVQMLAGSSDSGDGGGFAAGAGSGHTGGAFEMFGGDGDGGDGGYLFMGGGNAISGNANGGDATLQPGNGSGTGRNGLLFLNNLPTSDPVVANAVWNDAGVLKISAG